MTLFCCIIVFGDFRALTSSCVGYGCTFNECRLMLSLALFDFCWVWWNGSLLIALFGFVHGSYRTLFLSLVSCWHETWIYCDLQTQGLCVTVLFQL